jgi:predicted nuclease of predicted toxin-antitoxin system
MKVLNILIDMHLSPDWVPVFARHEIEAIHWSTVGDPSASDRTIMQWARDSGYVVFTHDLDFGALLAATQANGPSVIQVRTQNVLPTHLENTVISVIHQFRTLLESGALITVDESRSRVRVLPFS